MTYRHCPHIFVLILFRIAEESINYCIDRYNATHVEDLIQRYKERKYLVSTTYMDLVIIMLKKYMSQSKVDKCIPSHL